MELLKRIIILLLRIAGVAALMVTLVLFLFKLEEKRPVEQAEVIFAGTGNDADCAVLISRGACVVIDTGEEEDGLHILELLKANNVSKIDCLILTHPDKDHIGSASRLLENLSVKMIIMPYYMKDNDRLQVLKEEMERMNAPVVTLARSREFVFGDLEIRVFPPDKFSYDKDNNYSLITLAEHGNVRMLFAGDAQRERLEEMEAYSIGEVDLYKVPYHGRGSKKGESMIKQLKPQIAVITAPEADPGITEALAQENTQIFYTVSGKDLRFVSDGKQLVPEE
ncbi:ComEC/Rec2 family competence protein [Eisenbergiella porci]|uniref:ComEC/Rec2 family competence protein n=1 Tax=Eisenbergiella porci TaxID=2652274 RepID=UPI002A7EF4D7|nr:MBL fold metallo-hydrolase [Eisenbergiella porci]